MRFSQALAIVTLLASTAVAQQPALIAENAWMRATPGVAVAAVYLTLRNVTTHPVTVTGIDSPLAAHGMLHETSTQGGQSKMRPREQLAVPAQSTVKLEPGGLHVMLHDLKQPLTVGQSVPLVIHLDGGATVQAAAVVRPLGAE